TIDLDGLALFGADGEHAGGGYQVREIKTAEDFPGLTAGGQQVKVVSSDDGETLIFYTTSPDDPVLTLEVVDNDLVVKLHGDLDHGTTDLILDLSGLILAIDGDG